MPGTIDRLLAIRRMLFIGIVRPAMRSSDAPCLYQHQALIRQICSTPRSCMTSPPYSPQRKNSSGVHVVVYLLHPAILHVLAIDEPPAVGWIMLVKGFPRGRRLQFAQ